MYVVAQSLYIYLLVSLIVSSLQADMIYCKQSPSIRAMQAYLFCHIRQEIVSLPGVLVEIGMNLASNMVLAAAVFAGTCHFGTLI